MNRTGSNPTLERARKIAEATDAEREAARQDYIIYAKANRGMGSTPEPFDKYLAEWLDVQRVKLDAGEEPSQYERRDYSLIYGSGEK
jgi:hypothetical protein